MFWAFEKGTFQFFCKFLSDRVETVFWESEAKASKLFKLKFGHKNLPRKQFWSFLKLNNQYFVRLKRAFFSFFTSFWVTKLKPSSGKVRQRLQIYLDQNLIIRTFLENSFEAFWSSITNILFVWKGHFSVFLQIFKWRRRNCFRGKWDNTAKSFSIKSTLLRGF